MSPPILPDDSTTSTPDVAVTRTQIDNINDAVLSLGESIPAIKEVKRILGDYGPVLGAVALGFKALTAVLSPLSWAFEKLGGVVTGVFSFFKNTATGILQTAYKAYHGLYNITNVAMKQFAKFGFDVREQNKQVLEAGEQTKEMFDSMSTTGEAINKTLGSAIGMITSMSATTSKFARIFGLGAAGAAKMISETANQVGNMGNLSEIFGQQVFESANSIMTFTLATKGLGASADDIRAMSVISKSELQSFEMTLADIATAIRDVSTESGTNKKVLSKNFLALRKDFIDFGYIGDRELANVASRAIHLGLEISELSNMFKKVSTFEDATNMASQLSQAFGMNIDALEMLRAENPMDMIDMLRDSMLATGKTFDDMNRFERQLITQYTGLSGETAKLIFNYKDLGKSNAEIKKIMADNKPENQQLQALKEIETSVSKLIHIMDKDNPLGAFFEGLTTNIKRAIPGIQNISRTLESFYNMGLNIKPQTIKKLAAPFSGFIKDIDGSLKRLKSKIPEATKELGNFFEHINDDWTSKTGNAYNKANKHLQSFLGLSGRASSAFVTDFQRTALKMVGMGAKVAMTVIPTMMRITRNILVGIKKLFTGGIGSSLDKAAFDLFLRNNLGISLENFEEFFKDVKSIWKGEKGQEGLGDVFMGALKAVGNKLFEIMKPPITKLAVHLVDEIKKAIIATSPKLADHLGLQTSVETPKLDTSGNQTKPYIASGQNLMGQRLNTSKILEQKEEDSDSSTSGLAPTALFQGLLGSNKLGFDDTNALRTELMQVALMQAKQLSNTDMGEGPKQMLLSQYKDIITAIGKVHVDDTSVFGQNNYKHIEKFLSEFYDSWSLYTSAEETYKQVIEQLQSKDAYKTASDVKKQAMIKHQFDASFGGGSKGLYEAANAGVAYKYTGPKFEGQTRRFEGNELTLNSDSAVIEQNNKLIEQFIKSSENPKTIAKFSVDESGQLAIVLQQMAADPANQQKVARVNGDTTGAGTSAQPAT
jgi:hypothetical protein